MMSGGSSSEARHGDDAALTEFLSSLMDYTPTVTTPLPLLSISLSLIYKINKLCFLLFAEQIPDELVEHYLARSGFQCPDLRL